MTNLYLSKIREGVFAKLSPSPSSAGWTEIALFPADPTTHLPGIVVDVTETLHCPGMCVCGGEGGSVIVGQGCWNALTMPCTH